jgi:hypothetical protein
MGQRKGRLPMHNTSSAAPRQSRSVFGQTRGSVLIVVACLAGLYLLTLSKNHNEAEDSIHYIHHVTIGDWHDPVIWSANHLLHGPINLAFYDLWKLFGYSHNAQLPMQTLNVLFGLLTVLVFLNLARKLKLSAWASVSGALLLGVSHGFWWYSVECEVYILPLPFILLMFRSLVLIRRDFANIWNHISLGVWHAGAMLSHQQHVLLGLVVIGAYVLCWQETRMKFIVIVKNVTTYVGCGALLIIVSYAGALVFGVGEQGMTDPRGWFLGNAGSDSWGGWPAGGVVKAMIGISRAFIGAHFVFGYPAFAEMLQRKLPSFNLTEEVFLFQGFPASAIFFLGVLALLFGASIGYLIVRSLRTLGTTIRGSSDKKYFLILSGITVIIYAFFNLWWEPQNLEFWIVLVPILCLDLMILVEPATGLSSRRYATGMASAIAIVSLFVVNLVGSVLPQTDPDRDFWYVHERWLIEHASQEDVIVTGSGYIAYGYLELYTGAHVVGTWRPESGVGEDFDKALSSVHTGRVFFSSTVIHPPEFFARRYGWDNHEGKALYERVKDRLREVHSDEWQTIYLLNGAGAF